MMCLKLSVVAVLLLAACSAASALPQWVDDELPMPEVVAEELPLANQTAPTFETTFCKCTSRLTRNNSVTLM